MSKFYNDKSRKIGLPPGSLIHVGQKNDVKSKIYVFDYDASKYTEKELNSVEECYVYKDSPTITWLNIDGLEDIDIIEKIDSHFGIHPLVLEDIVSTGQRPKMEDYGDYIFVVLKMLYFDRKIDELVSEQVSLIVGPNYVISFQERVGGDVFNPIRDRIRNDKGKIRKLGADYLAYTLIDCIVDHYFVMLEHIGDQIEKLEIELLESPREELSKETHFLRRETIFLRKQIWPLREVISGLLRLESQLIRKSTSIYLRDVYDHTIQVIDTIESFRDMLTGLNEVYLVSLSHKMNEVMKVLTAFAAIFSPLTFIVGIYGMNFTNMPELHWHYGYFYLLIFMAVITSVMIYHFKKRDWL